MEILTLVVTILKVVLGISFVIFWHELGHFLLAKWNGVHVKTFSIGFPPTMARLFRFKETDYVIGWVPLGGYVRMLGDEEGEAKNPENPAATDPSAYHNQSVWARMSIISAGVVMNVILGLACYVLAYRLGGLPETPPLVGGVGAGGPAYVAGMRPGDEIIEINGKKAPVFDDLTQVVAHSANNEVVQFVVRRPGVEEPITLPIEPVRDPVIELPTIRVQSGNTLQLLKTLPFLAPAGMQGKPAPDFEGGDRIVQIGPETGELIDVSTPRELQLLLSRFRTQPLRVVVEREAKRDKAIRSDSSASAQRVTITIPPNRFVDFGFAPTLGPVTSVREGSPAEKAGFEVGDRLVSIDGEAVEDPLRLPSKLFDAIGQEVTFSVERLNEKKQAEIVEFKLTPEPGVAWDDTTWGDEPLNLDTVGLTVRIEPIIASVVPGSPAALAGLQPGEVIESLSVQRPTLGKDKQKPETVKFDFGPEVSYLSVFDQLQQADMGEVTLSIRDRKGSVKLKPEPVSDWYDPRRGFVLDSLTRPMPALAWNEAWEEGSQATVTAIGSMYRILQSLVQRRVGTKNLAGPVRIAGIAFQIAGRSWAEFIKFIGLLSINLAVVNFLPIPPLDGGKMVFLVGEAVRGRPVPESWQIAVSNVGVMLVLALMLFVMLQDVFLTLF